MNTLDQVRYFLNEEVEKEDKLSPTEELLKEYGITNYTINKNGTVDVDGDVDLSKKRLTDIPFKFGKVTGDFDLRRNQLTFLKGSPKFVGGTFLCDFNKLTTLEGGPKTVGGYSCSNNQLTSLKGSPKKTELQFDCSKNELTTLEGAPGYVRGDFDCSGNKKLKSLKGAPPKGIRTFIVYNCGKKFTKEDVFKVSEVRNWVKLAPQRNPSE